MPIIKLIDYVIHVTLSWKLNGAVLLKWEPCYIYSYHMILVYVFCVLNNQ